MQITAGLSKSLMIWKQPAVMIVTTPPKKFCTDCDGQDIITGSNPKCGGDGQDIIAG
jgi:hypothetical protein